ncbi:retrovirus-related Pol polyprotein from transposon gypsy [Trichonephila clavipes]|nr:retrovirus-related Pol polyprotein from transposon gypsy [Trichonephila clavipes]
MATLFQPTQEVKREGKMQIRKLLNNRSLESSPGEGRRLVSDIRVSVEYSHGLCAVKDGFVKSIPTSVKKKDLEIRLEPQVQDYVEVRNQQNTVQLLEVLSEERYSSKAMRGSGNSDNVERRDKPGLTHISYHEIDEEDKPPVVSQMYRYDRVKQTILNYHVEKILKERTMIPIQSPYASPVALCRKNNGLPQNNPEAYRFAVDYRKLNAITKGAEDIRRGQGGDNESASFKLPDFKKPFELFTDASSIGVGAVLNQEQRPVVLASRTLSSAEKKYSVTKRVCLALVWALNKFRTYLGSLPIKVITDHAALTRLTHDKNLSSRMIRWVLKLGEFNIEWEHRLELKMRWLTFYRGTRLKV